MATPFRELLRRHRGCLGLSQEELASKASLSTQTVSALERGDRRHPRSVTVRLLADALGLTGDDHDAFLAASGAGRIPPAVPESDTGTRTQQLPPTISDFTGREQDVATLVDLLASEGTRPTAVVISAIDGMAGVGKTTLAVHAGHLVAARFPDGQLHVNLRAYGPGEPMSTAEALHNLLRSLGTPTDQIPADVDAAAARYRSMLANRRVLVVLDNVADVQQGAPLLPGTAGCAAVLTSRRSLAALPGAHHLHIDVLTEREALDLLGAIASPSRLAAEPDAARSIVRSCGCLPLAIRIAGARLAARPRWPVSYLADRLADQSREPLDELETIGTGVRTSFTVSIDQLLDGDDNLDNRAAAAFDLLGIPEIPDISVPVAARLLDRSESDTEQTLERLVDAHLLETTEPGRYHLHDLLRSLARERASTAFTSASRAGAIARILDVYVAVAWRTHELIGSPLSGRETWKDRSWSESSPAFSSSAQAMAWLDSEHRNIARLVTQASETEAVPGELLMRLSIGMQSYYGARHRWLDALHVGSAALASSDTAADPRGAALVRRDLGWTQFYLRHYEPAASFFRESVDLFSTADDVDGQAMVLCHLSHTLEKMGRLDEAIDCSERSLALSHQLAEPGRVAAAYLCLGDAYGSVGDDMRQRDCHDRAREIFEELGDQWALTAALRQIAAAHRKAGRHDEAVSHLRRCVRLLQGLGRPTGQSAALAELGDVYLGCGKYSAALASYRRALILADSWGDRIGGAGIRHSLGLALDALGHREDARNEWLTALQDYQRIGHGKTDEVRDLLLSAQGS